MYNFRANIAVLMNITPDHLDRYDHCMQKYVDAKFRITQNQTPEDAFIFWNDDPIIKRELDKHGLRAHLYPFAAVKEDGAIAYVEDGEVEINEPIAIAAYNSAAEFCIRPESYIYLFFIQFP